jgi:hypothetical protein
MMEGVNSTTIYSKNFCKCHNVLPQFNNNMIIKVFFFKKGAEIYFLTVLEAQGAIGIDFW